MDMFHQALAAVSVDRIRTHVQSIEGIRHPVAAPAALERAGRYLAKTLEELGYDMGEHFFHDNGSQFSNIIATRAGSLFPDQRVIVVAHYDTVETSPGADDNASGVAVLLEIATILSGFSFEKSLLLVGVNLEENAGEGGTGKGTRGSKALARLASEQGWEVAGVLVLESVAFAGESVPQRAPQGLPLEVPEQGDFIAVIGNERSQALVRGFERAIDRYRVPLPFFSLVVPGNGEMLPDTRRSDHAPFWDKGFKAIMLTDTTNFRSPHYHRPSDTLETLNLPFAAQVCRATAGLVIDLAGPAGFGAHP